MSGRIARLETAMGVSDPEYFGPEIDALRSMARDPDSALD